MRVRSWVLFTCLCAANALCASLSASAFAQTADTDEGALAVVDRARRVGHEALAAFQAGDFERARGLFTEAEGLMHSPVFLLYRARSSAGLREYAAARRDYARVGEEELESSAPAAWRDAQRDAAREADSLVGEVIAVRVIVRGEFAPPLWLHSQEVSVELDERLVAFELDVSVLTAPRSFVLEDSVGRTSAFELDPSAPVGAEPARTTLFFEFWERAQPVASNALAPRTRPPAALAPAPREPSSWPTWTAFGIGAAGLVVAGVAGTLAVTHAAEVKAGCLGTSCRVEDRDLALEAERLGRVATVGTVVAVTGAALGLSLVLWNTDRARVTARLSPSSVALGGSF